MEHAVEGGGQSYRIAGRDEQGVAAVPGGDAVAGDVGRDDGGADGHGLDQRQSQGFAAQCGRAERGCGGHQPARACRRDGAEEVDPLHDAQAGCEPPRRIRDRAGDDHARGAIPPQQRGGPQQDGQSLARLVAADEENRARGCLVHVIRADGWQQSDGGRDDADGAGQRWSGGRQGDIGDRDQRVGAEEHPPRERVQHAVGASRARLRRVQRADQLGRG